MDIYADDIISELFGEEASCEKLRKAFVWCLGGESKTAMELAMHKEDKGDKDYARVLFFKALFFEENAWHKRTQIDCRRLRVLSKDGRGEYLAIPPEDNLPDENYGSMFDLIGAESKRLAQAMFRIYECTRTDYFGTATKSQIGRWVVLSHRSNSDNMNELLDIVFEGRNMDSTVVDFLDNEDAHIVFPALKVCNVYKTVLEKLHVKVEPNDFNLLSMAKSLGTRSDVMKIDASEEDVGKDTLGFAKSFYSLAKSKGMLSDVEFFDFTPTEWLMYYIILAGR